MSSPETPEPPNAPGWAVVGRIGAPYGVHGFVHLRSFTDPADNLLGYEPWYLGPAAARPGSGPLPPDWQPDRPAAVSDLRAHGDGYVARIAGAAGRDEAAALRNCFIVVSRSALPALPDGEYYWHDLLGMRVVTTGGEPLGRLGGWLETGAHAVMQVQGEQEHLVPFVAPYLVAVDEAAREIQVAWEPAWSE